MSARDVVFASKKVVATLAVGVAFVSIAAVGLLSQAAVALRRWSSARA
jgi:hypothetical protein